MQGKWGDARGKAHTRVSPWLACWRDCADTGVGAIGRAETRVSRKVGWRNCPGREGGLVHSGGCRHACHGRGRRRSCAGGGWCIRESANTRVAMDGLERCLGIRIDHWCGSELVFAHVLRIGEGVPKDLCYSDQYRHGKITSLCCVLTN